MVQPFKIRFTDKKTGENHLVEGEFPDDEWDKLLAFVSEVEKLKDSNILNGKLAVSACVHWNVSGAVNSECELPHDDDVATLLHRMRPFILQKESTSFYGICKILSRRLNHRYLRAVIERQHSEFSGKHFQGTISISFNDVPLNSEEMLHKWLNAYEYHRDIDKKRKSRYYINYFHWNIHVLFLSV